MSTQTIYLDNNATTMVAPEVNIPVLSSAEITPLLVMTLGSGVIRSHDKLKG